MKDIDYCIDCGEDVYGERVNNETGTYVEFPDNCPHCGEAMDCDSFDYREDFHADI